MAGAVLEELHGPLVPQGGGTRRERPEVPALAGPGIPLHRVESILPGREFADHRGLSCRRLAAGATRSRRASAPTRRRDRARAGRVEPGGRSTSGQRCRGRRLGPARRSPGYERPRDPAIAAHLRPEPESVAAAVKGYAARV